MFHCSYPCHILAGSKEVKLDLYKPKHLEKIDKHVDKNCRNDNLEEEQSKFIEKCRESKYKINDYPDNAEKITGSDDFEMDLRLFVTDQNMSTGKKYYC